MIGAPKEFRQLMLRELWCDSKTSKGETDYGVTVKQAIQLVTKKKKTTEEHCNSSWLVTSTFDKELP